MGGVRWVDRAFVLRSFVLSFPVRSLCCVLDPSLLDLSRLFVLSAFPFVLHWIYCSSSVLYISDVLRFVFALFGPSFAGVGLVHSCTAFSIEHPLFIRRSWIGLLFPSVSFVRPLSNVSYPSSPPSYFVHPPSMCPLPQCVSRRGCFAIPAAPSVLCS